MQWHIDSDDKTVHDAAAQQYANLVLADDAITGLRQALAGQFVSDEELDRSLGVFASSSS